VRLIAGDIGGATTRCRFTSSRSPAAMPGTAELGYLHCGPNGAGHFVKMVHNGIEYGLMAAYAEGLNIIKNANDGLRTQAADAETTPLRHPGHCAYEIDIEQVAEVWRRGSVVASWLLDLAASALRKSPDLGNFAGRVSDSGEGRWTLQAAIDQGVPAPVISSTLFTRFSSRGEANPGMNSWARGDAPMTALTAWQALNAHQMRFLECLGAEVCRECMMAAFSTPIRGT
jgi:6-phosphogluconate dehydrogenase (decarboxylating)